MNSISTDDLILELTITDSEVIVELDRFPAGDERENFALKAIKIGVMALKQARGQIDVDAVRREGEKLMGDLKHRLEQHEQLLSERMGSTLKEYFDPKSGRFQERIELLVKQDGELERTLKRQIAGDESELARTLLMHFGEESPLMRMLSPDQSRGILSLLKQEVDAQLKFQRDHILNQFSLNDKESALSILLRELGESHGKLNVNLSERIDTMAKEFSLNEENSALSRLVKNVDIAHKTITKEFSLDNEGSSLVRLQKTLSDLLTKQQDENQKFQIEIKEALAAMKARKEESLRSTRHGVEFETVLFEVIQKETQRQGDIAERTGNTTGMIKLSKVGDVVIELSPDSAAAGEKIVIEAKEKDGYSLKDARTEIETARVNRGAQIGLFVFSRRTAPEGLEPVLRIGDDVYVVWDSEDETSDLYLRVGYTLAKALCCKGATLSADRQADFECIERAINEIIKQTDGLTEIETWATTIKNSSEKIMKKIETARKKVLDQAEVLKENTIALKGLSE